MATPAREHERFDDATATESSDADDEADSNACSAPLRGTCTADSPLVQARVACAFQVEAQRSPHRPPSLDAVYLVEAIVGSQTWVAHRRFSDFEVLAQHVQRRCPVHLPIIPPFPPRRPGRGGLFGLPGAWAGISVSQDSVVDMGASVMEERTTALDRWLRALVELMQLSDPVLLAFIVPEYVAVRIHAGDVDAADLLDARKARPLPAEEAVAGPPPSLGSRAHARLAAHPSSIAFLRPSYAGAVSRMSHAFSRAALEAIAVSQKEGRGAAANGSFPPREEAALFIDSICSRTLLKTCTMAAAAIYIDRIALSVHDIVVRRAVPWELLLLAVIVVAAKQWESDAPIWSADFVFAAKHWPRVAKLPTGTMNEAEWLVLSRLDFRTLVSRRELQESCCSEPDVQR